MQGNGFCRNAVPPLVMCEAAALFVFRPRTDEAKGRGKLSSLPIVRLGYNPEAHLELLGPSGIEGWACASEGPRGPRMYFNKKEKLCVAS